MVNFMVISVAAAATCSSNCNSLQSSRFGSLCLTIYVLNTLLRDAKLGLGISNGTRERCLCMMTGKIRTDGPKLAKMEKMKQIDSVHVQTANDNTITAAV